MPMDKKTKKSDQKMLDEIKEKIFKQIKENKIQLKVGDLLKILEIQKKLYADSGTEEKFWEMIEKLRQEELKRE